MFANAEHFVILPMVGGLVLLLRAVENDSIRSLTLSGFLLGLAFLMKQHGAAFVAAGAVYLFINLQKQRPLRWARILGRCGTFALAAALPYLLTCLILWMAGVFDEFWFWTVSYARRYVTQIPLDRAWAVFIRRGSPVFGATPMLWALAAVGLTALFWDRSARRRWLFMALFAVFSFLAICPGFFFRAHYFVLTLPAAALMIGVAISALGNLLARTHMPRLQYSMTIGLAVSCLAASVIQQRQFLFWQTPTEVARTTYSLNPFPESLEIAKIIKASTSSRDRIAVLGSEPQIFFYSNRRSATGHIYTYALMEDHDLAKSMQEEMIREIEASDPTMLVNVQVATSWLRRRGSHRLIFDWFSRYRRRFDLTTVVKLQRSGAQYYHAEGLSKLELRPPFIEIYTRHE